MSVPHRQVMVSGHIPSPNLWDKALETLSIELRTSLDLTRAGRGEILSRALKEAREKKQLCAKKCWTLKRPNGETIIVRDVVEKIIVWIEKFIAVGDAAVQYDPGHAAPAWAAFRFVLQLVVNDKRVFGEMVENLEAISHLITRYAILEELYIQRDSSARNQLEDMVIRLYAEILIFLAKARNYFQSSTKVRLAMSVIKFSEDEQIAKIRVLDRQISSLTEIFSVDIQIDTAESLASMHALLASLSEPIKRLVDQSSICTQVLQQTQQLQVLHWLSLVPYPSHHKRHSESRIEGSGEWLLHHEKYLNWRNSSSSSVFLLYGIPGCGKTSLASAVVDSFLQGNTGQASPAPTGYFYCTRNLGEAERSNPDEIMRSILRQLTVSHGSSSTVHERVLKEYERRQAQANIDGFEVMRLLVPECVRLILETLAINPANIVIDAVDEIEPSSRHVLLSALTQIVRNSLSVVKVFVTSRDDSNIHVLLSDAVALRILPEYTRKDIEGFVHQEVLSAIQNKRLLNGDVSDNLKRSLMKALVDGAGEMFLWVVRQIESVCRMKTEADVRSAMPSLSTQTLNDLYEKDFIRLSTSGQHTKAYATQIFSMLLCMQEALSPEALIQATAKSIALRGGTLTLADVLDICLNLIVLDFELNVLRFAHTSIQEFLETKAEFATQSVHRVAATSCLSFCLEGLPRATEINLNPKDNFHHYSAVYWAEHCRITIENGADDVTDSKLEEWVFDEGEVALAFVDWVQEVSRFVKRLPNDHALAKELHAVIHSGGNPLFTACTFGLVPIVDYLVNTADHDWNEVNDFGQSGLYLAAAAGHITIVQTLLQRGAFINASGGKFGHPLHAACFRGHAKVVELLLDHGADPRLGPRNALEYALLADHEKIALLLLDGRFDISDQAMYDSILQLAAEAGFANVIQFLQKKYAPRYGKSGSQRCKAIEVAIFKGRIGVIERYMGKLRDSGTTIPEDAIATAALGGQDDMVSFLVDRGLDLNREGVLGTPLRAASLMCHESTVKLLLNLGANLHVSGSFGEPLQASAMRGHESVTRTLLSHGADVNSKGGLYGTALQAAAHRGHRKIVEILLDSGAQVYQDGFSRDAFHAASEGGHEEIVHLLLERGFKLQHTLPGPAFIIGDSLGAPSGYRNFFDEPPRSQHLKMGPIWDYHSQSKDWRERASIIDYSHIFEMMQTGVTSEPKLVQSYREQDEISDAENYALRAAAAQGQVTVVELLLSQLDRLDISEFEIIGAFEEACKNGHVKVVNQMLSSRMKMRSVKAALRAAALNGHLTVVDILINYEERLGLAKVEIIKLPNRGTYQCDSTARVVLESGSEEGHLLIFRRGQGLVAHRCSDVASEHLYRQALTTAAMNCQPEILTAIFETEFDLGLEDLTKTLNSICARGSVEALKLCLEQDTKKMLGVREYSSGLSQAARKDNRQIVLYWLNDHLGRHDLFVDSATMVEVSGNGLIDIIPPLIRRISSAESLETTLGQCLQIASRNGHEAVVEYLIGLGADVNFVVDEVQYNDRGGMVVDGRLLDDKSGGSRKLSALQAALIGFERFSLNAKLYRDGPGLVRADDTSQRRIIGLLLRKGANPNRVEGCGRHPLGIAAEQCPVEIVQQLILSGARVEAATKDHGVALQMAARRELDPLLVIKVLVEAEVPISSLHRGKVAALAEALSFFGGFSGSFIHSATIVDILRTGPGAVVKTLLADLPEEKARDSRYGLLAQMACVAGDQACLELLLQRGMDVNLSGNHYGTALQAASCVGNIEIVQCLMDAGADANLLGGAHGSALRAATVGGHQGLVHNLIARGAAVNLCYKNSDESILHLALESGSHAIFEALLVAGADTNPATSHHQHVLIAACKQEDVGFVELLLARGVDVNVQSTEPSTYGREASKSSVVRLRLDKGADTEKTNDWSTTPLISAIHGNNLAVVRLMLDAGVNVNQVSNCAVIGTPLSEAAENCKLDIVKELLSAGAIIGGPSTRGNALAKACRRSQHMVVELLLETLSGTQYEAEVLCEALSDALEDGDDKTVHLLLEYGVPMSMQMLRKACSAARLEAVQFFVEKGININEDDGDDAPLLHVAASHSRPEIVQFLINRGANVMFYSTRYGSPLIAALEGAMSPFLRSRSQPLSCQSLAEQLPLPGRLHVAVWTGDDRVAQEKPGYKEVSQCEQIVRSLFDAGADMDTTIRSFGNALHLASYMGNEVIVSQMLERMEDVNIFGGYFESPLIAGLKGNNPSIVKLLLDRGIDTERSSPECGRALQYACAHGSIELVQTLLDGGADINAYDDTHGSALAVAASESKVTRSLTHGYRTFEEQRAIFEMLLRHEPKVQIRNGDLLAAASWRRFESGGQQFISLFLNHDDSIVATEEVIVSAIQNYSRYMGSEKTLMLLLKHDGGLGTTPAMLENAETYNVMKTLLDHRPVCRVTADVLESAIKRQFQRFELVKLLLTHDPNIPVAEAAILGYLRSNGHHDHESILSMLLDRNHALEISDKMLEAVQRADEMEVLLQRRGKEQKISSRILEKAAGRRSIAAKLVTQLLEHDKSIKITPTVLSAAIANRSNRASNVRALLEYDSGVEITQEDLMGLRIGPWGNDETDILKVLVEYGKIVESTAKLEEWMNNQLPSERFKEAKELLHKLDRRNVKDTVA